MTVSDRIVVMNKGEMMQIGTPFEIYSRPANRFVADFIGKVNLIPVTIDSIEEGIYSVIDAHGTRLVAVSAAADLHKGDRALFMLRPESLTIAAVTAEKAAAQATEATASDFVAAKWRILKRLSTKRRTARVPKA